MSDDFKDLRINNLFNCSTYPEFKKIMEELFTNFKPLDNEFFLMEDLSYSKPDRWLSIFKHN